MNGIDAYTGRRLAGLAHLHQSVGDILTTPIGSRVARRDYGSDLFELIDAPEHGATRVRLFAATATALMRWEPRICVKRIRLTGVAALDGVRALEIDSSVIDPADGTGDARHTDITSVVRLARGPRA